MPTPESPSSFNSCPKCNGKGTIVLPLGNNGGVMTSPCPQCYGTGEKTPLPRQQTLKDSEAAAGADPASTTATPAGDDEGCLIIFVKIVFGLLSMWALLAFMSYMNRCSGSSSSYPTRPWKPGEEHYAPERPRYVPHR